jgi:hypothetical protein
VFVHGSSASGSASMGLITLMLLYPNSVPEQSNLIVFMLTIASKSIRVLVIRGSRQYLVDDSKIERQQFICLL